MTEEQSDSPAIRDVYDRIGEHFSKTREYPWADVTEFLEGRSGAIGLDVGCGNGRHTEALASVVDKPVGVDLSRTLLNEARDRAMERDFEATFVQGTATSLPIGTDAIDLGLYVAALHHLRTRRERIASLDELARVLSPTGRALISTWSTTHDKFDREEGFDTHVDWTLPGGETVARFYHIYDPEEFEAELADSRLTCHSTWVSAGNCYARVGPR